MSVDNSKNWWTYMRGEEDKSYHGGHRNKWWDKKKEDDDSEQDGHRNKWWDKKKKEETDSSDSTNTQTTPAPTGYLESDAVKALRQQMEAQLGLKPGDYVSQWQPQINALTDQILNRKDFQYDLNADALYQMYKDRYVNLGQRAMMDTMGQAAALTGGYGNSAAQLVGQQAYQGYLQGLTDKIPELYQIALDRYNQAGQDLYQKYGLVNTQEQNAYNQWQDNFNRWLAERDFATGRYDTERGFDYGTYRDTVGDAQWKEELAAQERQWQAQLAEQIRQFNYLNMEEGSGGSGGGGGGYSSGGGSSGGGGGGSTPTTATHNDMVKEVNQYRNDAINAGVSESEAQKNALLMAGEWYQEKGKYK